ncbi:MAG TPA: tetratricopeptide repeat protein [Gemmatimonadales bacterium]|nr:tetratricopeptide repeat protein [Gemmatimonadales bacterium]
MALSEIEKLERRYAENPQGLTFAPLAEVHRKNGDVARALELLRPGLTLHPDYIPASIVLGRCHLDLGELPAAEAAFTHVLSLDGENVIALKALAEIAERQFRFDESERWLRTLLAIDRSNDEAREQLTRVEASRLQAETASSASPDAAMAVVGDEALAPPEPVTEAEAPTAALEPVASEPAAEHAPLELEELDLAHIDEPARPAGMEIEQPVTLDEPVEPLSGLVGRHDQESGSDLHVSSDSWQVETAEDIVLNSAGASEFQMANAAEELLDSSVSHAEPSLGERPPMERDEPPAPESASVAEAADDVSPSTDRVAAGGAASETAPSLSGAETNWSPPAAESPGQSEADLLVTESMAELLLQQGHTTEALSVYRHLESRTGSPRFRDKVAELERKSAPAAAASPFAAQPTASPAAGEASGAAEPTPVPNPAYSVQQTHGQSVHAFLRGVLSARPPAASSMPAQAGSKVAAPDASASGAPTRPAHDSLSLSSVFGEESTPTPPAVPAGGAGTGSGGVSYDEFFGTASSAPARPSRTPDAKSDDLDQFHAWLQNLKR